LDARLGEYVLVARRSGYNNDWYIGGMTNWTGRELEVDLSFLPPGNFTMEAYRDGINADRFASDYVKTTTQVTSGQKLKITLAPGGGWAARIHP
jgi:alpha-glucosidase